LLDQSTMPSFTLKEITILSLKEVKDITLGVPTIMGDSSLPNSATSARI
jgi:hypothetical protein